MTDIPKRPDHMPTSLLRLWQNDPDVREYLAEQLCHDPMCILGHTQSSGDNGRE